MASLSVVHSLKVEDARGRGERATARGFEAGRTGRRLRSIPTTTTAINTLIRSYGRSLLARSRYLALNNSYAMAAREAYVSALVGSGIKPSSLHEDKNTKKEIQKLFLDWTDEADADGLTDFFGLQTIVAGEMFEAGECFVRVRRRFAKDGLSVPIQLQLLPAEMLPTDHNEALPNGGRVECGIEFDAIGRRAAYWFYRRHPGELLFTFDSFKGEKVRVPADEVLHLFRPIRAGQIRGIPHTIAGIVTLALLDLYDDAELERKRTAALFAAFVTRNPGDKPEDNPLTGATSESDAGTSDFTLEPGAVVDLDAGQSVVFSEPADVGTSYEAFQYRNLLRAAAGFGVPYASMTGDMKAVNYSSIRAGLVEFRRRIEQHQHHVMVYQFCRAIWIRWFELAVLAAKLPITATAYVANPQRERAAKWVTPKWDWVDPYKDLLAEKLAVDAGFKARSDVVEALGVDPEENDARIAQDQERADAAGISFIRLSSSVIVAPDTADDGESLVDPGNTSVDIPPSE